MSKPLNCLILFIVLSISPLIDKIIIVTKDEKAFEISKKYNIMHISDDNESGVNDAVALADHHNKDVPYCFNRKEVKDHGEGGSIVGHSLEGDILIIDDVITAGTAIREAQDIITANGAKTKGVIVALDRQEKGNGELSAIQEVEETFGITVLSIINLSHIVDYLKDSKDEDTVLRIEHYRSQYGIK